MLRFWNSGVELQSLVTEGADFYQKNRIVITSEESTDDGKLVLSARAIDQFNFVSHPVLTIDPDAGLILGSRCDCDQQRFGLCRHQIAVLLAIGEQIDASPAPRDAPAAGVPGSGEITLHVIHEQRGPAPSGRAAPGANASEPLAEGPSPAEAPAEGPEARQNPDGNTPEPRGPGRKPEPRDFVPPGIRVRLGQRLRTEEAVEWTPNDTERLFHSNTGIIGTMGTGKTQLTKSMICQFIRNKSRNFASDQVGVLIFDYKGDYNATKEDFVRAVGARVLKPYKLPYNPLALIAPPSPKPLLPFHTANAFVDTMARIYPLGPKQQQILLDCIREAYEERGIFADKPETWKRIPPTFAKVHEIFTEQTASRAPDSLTAAVNKLNDFCIFDNSRVQTGSIRDLLKGVVVIDLSGYDQNIQDLVVAITLDLFYSQMLTLGSGLTDGRYRQMRQLILVDEADNFMSKDFPVLRRILKEGREFGVGTILSTQSLSHFVSGKDNYSRYILSWVVHSVADLRQKDVEYIFKLPVKSAKISSIYAVIKNLEKHQSVVKLSNEDPVTIQDLPFWRIAAEQDDPDAELEA